jgi:DNA-binding NarL/FixJ family response regulator
MKILVVDDHALIREAMRGVVADLSSNAALLEASDSRQAMHLIAEHSDVGLVLLDLNLPDRAGLSVLSELREHYPEIAVVILTGAQDLDNALKALNLGAAGFISKSGSREVMMSAVQLVLAGGIYFPPEALGHEQGNQSIRTVAPTDLGLTGRQVEVLGLIMLGKSNKAICRTLNLAEPTVKNHVTAILRALKVTNRTEAAISARELGWSTAPGTTLVAGFQVPHSALAKAAE